MKNKISDIIICIGTNVKKFRLEKGMTQQDLAFNCGNMDRSTISNIECFNCNGLNISTVIKISCVLEIDVSDLFKK